MCMCGGIIEIGAIAALVGYIGKRIHKCKCDCHEEHIHKCKHCSGHFEKQICVVKNLGKIKIGEYMVYDINRNKRKQLFYKVIQYILGAVLIVGMGLLAYGVYDIYTNHHHEHTKHCVHK